MELQGTEMQKTVGRVDLLQEKGKFKDSFGHAWFKIPIRHLSGDIR